MTKKIFYEKIGRKYVPVKEYDSEFLDGFPKGNHLVMVYPGGSSRKFNIDPDFASLVAAGRVAHDKMTSAIVEASKLRPSKTPITPDQKKAWEDLAKSFDQEMYTLNGASANEIAEAGLKALYNEAKILLTNEASKKAFEHFLLIATLSKEQNNDKG